MMTYQEAVQYLGSFVNFERTHQPKAMRKVKLERMRSLCRRLGEPQRGFRSAVIGGTNGKGSICAMLYAMLRESALRVGLYTSPHTSDPRERIRVSTDGPPSGETTEGQDWISERALTALIEELQPVLDAMRRESPKAAPTYFEALTAAALLFFRQQQVDIAVLEVGLGGRLDATNVVEQSVSVFGPIAVDHADVLGDDPAAIAREKAGIIKPRQTVISARQTDAVTDVLCKVCETRGVPLLIYGTDLTASIRRHSVDGLELSLTGLRGIYEGINVPLIGRHQAENAALAVGALEVLSETGIPFGLVERGLAQVEWPCRLEVINDAPLVILDGAHNLHAAQALRSTVQELVAGRRLHLIIGMSADKAVEQVGACLGPLAHTVTCTSSRHPRALAADQLATRLALAGPEVHVVPDLADAYTYVLNTCEPTDVIVVAGSLFLAGELRGLLRKASVRPRHRLAPA